jgi:SpoVK/Ycf46/Vps4 family AAA+-type ATPase
MESQFRFMSEIYRIINGALRLDIDKVRNYTLFLADKIEKDGDARGANRLRKLLVENDHQLRPVDIAASRTLPVDSESRFPLVEKVKRKATSEAPLVLSDDQWVVVHEFLSMARSHAQIEAEGFSSTLCLLLYGPPGTGKSRLARFIGDELGMDMYVARLDGLVSSFLGSTSKNIRALFDFVSKTPCVLFLDEFDAIAKLRSDQQELGELKRVVNSFIQNLDSMGSHSIVVAATNHESLLDNAVWRRFSYRLRLTLPKVNERKVMINNFLPPIDFAGDLDLIANLTEGFSGSDISESILRLQRMRITRKNPITPSDLFVILQNIAVGESDTPRFLAATAQMERPSIARTLRDRDPKLFSQSALASLLGTSKTTVHRWLNDG